MEEEQPFGQRRHAAEPQIGALQVCELVAQHHLLLPLAQRREAPRRQEDHRPPQPGDERRLDAIGDAYVGHAFQADPGGQIGGPAHGVLAGGARGAQDGLRLVPAADGDEPDEDQAGAPHQRREHAPLAQAADDRRQAEAGAIAKKAGDEPRHDARTDAVSDARDELGSDVGRRCEIVRVHGRGAGNRRRRRRLRRQHGNQNRRRPGQGQDELGGGAPPEEGACRRGERQRTGQNPHRGDHEGAVNRCAQERPRHDDHRSFPRSACSRATISSSSCSSSSVSRPASERYARNGETDPSRLRSTKRCTALFSSSADEALAR